MPGSSFDFLSKMDLRLQNFVVYMLKVALTFSFKLKNIILCCIYILIVSIYAKHISTGKSNIFVFLYGMNPVIYLLEYFLSGLFSKLAVQFLSYFPDLCPVIRRIDDFLHSVSPISFCISSSLIQPSRSARSSASRRSDISE